MNVQPNDPQQAPGLPARITTPSRLRAPDVTPGASGRGHGVQPSGTVEISAQAREYLKVRSQLDSAGAMNREERVARLRDLVARDAYHVDGTVIAGAMLEDAATAFVLGLPVGR